MAVFKGGLLQLPVSKSFSRASLLYDLFDNELITSSEKPSLGEVFWRPTSNRAVNDVAERAVLYVTFGFPAMENRS